MLFRREKPLSSVTFACTAGWLFSDCSNISLSAGFHVSVSPMRCSASPILVAMLWSSNLFSSRFWLMSFLNSFSYFLTSSQSSSRKPVSASRNSSFITSRNEGSFCCCYLICASISYFGFIDDYLLLSCYGLLYLRNLFLFPLSILHKLL